MSQGTQGSHGPDPWLQRHWDWRAAGNFVLGGAGAGLVIAALIGRLPPELARWVALAGAVLVGGGLFSVALELGRPLRAPRVIVNPRTSWMSREAIAAGVLFAAVAAGVWLGSIVWIALAALAALAFVWCQGRILHGGKGIPAWRQPLVPALILSTGVAEGLGLLTIAALAWGGASGWQGGLLVLAVVVRQMVVSAYRRSLDGRVGKPAIAALEPAFSASVLVGSLVPIALVVLAAVLDGNGALLALAGAAAAAAGAWFKFLLVTRASWNQGFTIPEIPVRGVRSL